MYNDIMWIVIISKQEVLLPQQSKAALFLIPQCRFREASKLKEGFAH